MKLLSDSYTSFDKAKENGLIAGYQNYFDIPVKEQVPYPAPESKGWLSIPAGYIISSAPDMGNYLQVYLNAGGDIITKESIDTMFNDKVKVLNDVYYGMGWGSLTNYSEPVIYHGGLVENYSSVMFLLPESGVVICLLTNTNHYLVGNSIMNKVFLNIIKIMTGEEPEQVDGISYLTKHLLYDGIYLILVICSLLPLLRIRRWKKRWESAKSYRWLVWFIGIHVIIPSLIFLFPLIVHTPFSVIKGFVPDLYWVLIFFTVLLYTN